MSRDTSVVVVVESWSSTEGNRQKHLVARADAAAAAGSCCRNTQELKKKMKKKKKKSPLLLSGCVRAGVPYIILALATICPTPNFLIPPRDASTAVASDDIPHFGVSFSSSSSQTRSIHVDSKKRLINPIRYLVVCMRAAGGGRWSYGQRGIC